MTELNLETEEGRECSVSTFYVDVYKSNTQPQCSVGRAHELSLLVIPSSPANQCLSSLTHHATTMHLPHLAG